MIRFTRDSPGLKRRTRYVALLLVYRVGPGIGLVLAAALISTVLAVSVVKMSLQDLTRKASIIVVGRVTDRASEKTADGLKTRITLAVSDSLKGAVGKTVVVTQPGGSLGQLGMVVSEAAVFEKGEEAVVFLWTRANGEHAVLGLSQGKLPVETGADGKKSVRLPPEEGTDPGEKVALEECIRRIKAILAGDSEGNG
jgi:hypothetical protein